MTAGVAGGSIYGLHSAASRVQVEDEGEEAVGVVGGVARRRDPICIVGESELVDEVAVAAQGGQTGAEPADEDYNWMAVQAASGGGRYLQSQKRMEQSRAAALEKSA